jgi:hypothetical protein
MRYERTESDDLRHVLRAVRAHVRRPADASVTSPAVGVFVVDYPAADASVTVRRLASGAWSAEATQDGAPGEREQVAACVTPWGDDVRVVVFAALAACDGLRCDLDDVDDGLDGLDVADLLAAGVDR